MGFYHILSVSDDALRLMPSDRQQVEQAVGGAIYTLCVDPQFRYLGRTELERVTSASVLNTGSAVRHAGEYHHTALEVLVWNRGWCSKPADLTIEELENAIALLQHEKAERS